MIEDSIRVPNLTNKLAVFHARYSTGVAQSMGARSRTAVLSRTLFCCLQNPYVGCEVFVGHACIPNTPIFAIVTPATQEWYGASMNWRAVHGRIRELWSAIVEDLPERSKRARGQIKYGDERVFEAALYMVRHNIAMRDLEDERYPSPNPLYLRLAAMVRSRVLDRAWAAYLENASRAELETWAAAFERIRRNRRRSTKGKARRPRAKDKDSPSKPERTGLSPGLAWLEILLRGLEDVCAEKGIDMERFIGRDKR